MHLNKPQFSICLYFCYLNRHNSWNETCRVYEMTSIGGFNFLHCFHLLKFTFGTLGMLENGFYISSLKSPPLKASPCFHFPTPLHICSPYTDKLGAPVRSQKLAFSGKLCPPFTQTFVLFICLYLNTCKYFSWK